MNQPRRTFLQVLLGLFGLGAAKAVAKTQPAATLIEQWHGRLVFHGSHDAYIHVQTQFDAAMGVVNRGGFCSLATIQLADTRDRDTGFVSGSGWMQSLCFDQIAASAKRRNAMIFAESSGPDGTQLVAELMKRCPERVFHGIQRENRTPGVTLSGRAILYHGPLALDAANWVSDDRDANVAHYLALCGTDFLSGTKTQHVLVLE